MRFRGWIALASTLAIAGASTLWLVREHWRARHPGVVALQRAWEDVRGEPELASAWAALGDAQTAVDQVGAAEHSYRTAMRLGPADPSVPARLGFLLYGRGDDAQALPLLEQALRRGANVPLLEQTVARLRHATSTEVPEDAAIAESADLSDSRLPPEMCSVPVRRARQGGTFVVDARIADEVVPLVVDTGASITVLSSEAAQRLGLSRNGRGTLRALTANGAAELETAKLRRLILAGRVVEDLVVAICERCEWRGAEGLLGLDVQAAVGAQLHLASGELRFAGCEQRSVPSKIDPPDAALDTGSGSSE